MSRATPLPESALPAAAFRVPARIRFHDCDPAGIVFFGAWFAIANAAIEDWFEGALGLSFHEIHEARRIGTGFVHAEADYFRPGLMGDRLLVTPLVTRIGGASYALDVHVHRAGEPLVRFRLVTATTDLDARRAIPIPDDLRAALSRYAAACGLTDAAARGEEHAA
jgi:4-hydroxybenzoyl-CoA thioesterase